MNVGSLFAGIGGFDLGLERAGFEVSWQVELDPFCRAVLARRFPAARRLADVREVGEAELGPVDLICGGFPCQDLSVAGGGAGLEGARSGLWAEFARIVRELGPRYVLVENVPALLTGKGKRWDRAPIGRVLGDLAEAGYDAEWACLSAREFGAPHLRRRVWVLAYPGPDLPDTERRRTGHMALRRGGRQGRRSAEPSQPALLRQGDGAGRPENARAHRPHLADADRDGRQEGVLLGAGAGERVGSADALGGGPLAGAAARAPWASEPGVGRVADGVPDRVERLAALGNALVPQIAEWIGRRILEHEEEGGRR
ncbi:MAG: DNA cytosine methyltransferase [Solirubrobacterales bacterium]